MTAYTDDDVTAVMDGRDYLDEREARLILAAVAPAIAARALRQAATDLESTLARPGYPQNPYEFRAWLRARAEQVNP